jgi:hypothetical protein
MRIVGMVSNLHFLSFADGAKLLLIDDCGIGVFEAV